MERDAKDRSVGWLMEHHGDALARAVGLSGFTSWQSGQNVLTFPKRAPDGLIELVFPDGAMLSIVLEVTTYPDAEEAGQAMDDAALVMLARRVVPEVYTLVLRPRGQQRLEGSHTRTSQRGTTRLGLTWVVVNLWEVSAANLLALNDVGAVPLVPLARFDGPPEPVLEVCRRRIEEQAAPEERDNLLAIAYTLAAVRYNDRNVLDILARSSAMKASPFYQEVVHEAEVRNSQSMLLGCLKRRFGEVPEDVVAKVRLLTNLDRLEELVFEVRAVANLDAFRALLEEVPPAS